MRRSDNSDWGTRASALWGKRNGGETRSRRPGALRGGSLAATIAGVLALVVPAAALPGDGTAGCGTGLKAVVPAGLVSEACASRSKQFAVIVQPTAAASDAIAKQAVKLVSGTLKKDYRSLSSLAVRLSGDQLLKLGESSYVLAITRDGKLAPTAYENAEMWRATTGVDRLWDTVGSVTGTLGTAVAPQPPAIAIVDSGVDASKLDDFGARVVASVSFASTSPSTADEQGHGTMVAGVAAGGSALYPGAARTAPIVSLKTADANGMSYTSDVLAAIDWILANKDTYNIRVANFSLNGNAETSFRFDPLDKAVEKLWFNGVVVVAAAGNHGSADGPVNMSGAPGNDPFIITVGATDQRQTSSPADDVRAPWSAYGHTADGFAKPEVVAPGRYLVMPVPGASTIATTVPDRVVAPGYMWMSGTSFAAPVVAGAAAQLLARHPDWTPDQVKGALMHQTVPLASAGTGVGAIDAAAAAALTAPPNANENLWAFVEPDAASGGLLFNAATWTSHVQANATWTSATWTSATWTSATWTSATWTSATWTSSAWSSATWTSATWTSATWTSATWTSSTYVD